MTLGEKQTIIEKEVLLPKQSRKEKARDLQLLQENLELILKHQDMILASPELFHSGPVDAVIGLIYMGGHRAPIGVLLRLWQQDLLMALCPHCAGRLYIFSAGGSPLSGINRATGICASCKQFVRTGLPSIGMVLKALKELKASLNRQRILRTRGQYFSFKDGLAGEPVPDVILEPGITPVSFEELLCRLKQHDTEKQ
ncbi:hypothetical protein [Desulfosudis oleivorans]|uniref:Uncharacterized protein n=1 Tax=Desulfosudis oleivorans (strain DSM 6200 / JCM 39069 / Hxd3) TaxID=96561 RepID=A8ZS56_DESOH|nr:hypothetical protein [Desulfosudis oleivorans]ABW66074.1 hypothetical protein Dole_0264 [Desulfosudis oleivorans Hxd3]